MHKRVNHLRLEKKAITLLLVLLLPKPFLQTFTSWQLFLDQRLRQKHPFATYSVAWIFYEYSNWALDIKMPPGCPFLSEHCFAFFKHTQMIYAGCVKVTPGKPQTCWEKFHLLLGRLNILRVKGKNTLGQVSLGLLQRVHKSPAQYAKSFKWEKNAISNFKFL